MLKQSCDRSAKPAGHPLQKRSRARLREEAFSKFSLPRADLDRIVEEFFIALDSPLSLSCLILYRHGDFEQLVQKEIDPGQYNDPLQFRDDFAAISFLRKNTFLKTGTDLRAVAISSFKTSEEACKVTNRRFQDLAFDPQFQGSNVWLLNALTRKIARVLGDFSIEELFDRGSWGPGVTTLIKGKDVSASRKFREENGITTYAYQLLEPLLSMAYPRWFDETKLSTLRFLDANQVITVPKNAKTDRTIAIEPGLNSWFQLAAGKSIRKRLRKAGFDLNSDKRNQSGALTGALTGRLATVDFSSASDTIAARVVEEILPRDWFIVLDALRSHSYNLDGETLPYAKFSAMGNGFTFELESLIFICAALVVCEYQGLDLAELSVFGDDIIIPVEAFEQYRSFCTFLGFTVNSRKSFSTGYFRESCGSYFFSGLDCKPIFLKDIINGAKSLYKLANAVRILAHRRNLFCGCDARFLPVWRYLNRCVPIALRALGPRSSGDACIHVNFDEGTPRIARDAWCGFLHSAFLDRPVCVSDENPSLILARVWSLRGGGLNNLPSDTLVSSRVVSHIDSLRALALEFQRDNPSSLSHNNDIGLRSVTRTKFKHNVFAPQWYNFGPWY